jgi:hypothetical protein
MAGSGVTEAQVVPWFFYGGDPTSLDVQLQAVSRFAATVMAELRND